MAWFSGIQRPNYSPTQTVQASGCLQVTRRGRRWLRLLTRAVTVAWLPSFCTQMFAKCVSVMKFSRCCVSVLLGWSRLPATSGTPRAATGRSTWTLCTAGNALQQHQPSESGVAMYCLYFLPVGDIIDTFLSNGKKWKLGNLEHVVSFGQLYFFPFLVIERSVNIVRSRNT